MTKLSLNQQAEEIRDIEEYIRTVHPLAIVELQSQQIRRLVYFSKKGIEAHRIRGQQLQAFANSNYNVNVEDKDGE